MTTAHDRRPTTEDKQMKLEVTATFPKIVADVLEGAPTDCDQFRDSYEVFSEYIITYSTPHYGDIFCGIDKSRALQWLQMSENKQALDYALEKGWVKWKKEPRVIEVEKHERITLHSSSNHPKVEWNEGSISRIEIE